jgi:hypothetical protein
MNQTEGSIVKNGRICGHASSGLRRAVARLGLTVVGIGALLSLGITATPASAAPAYSYHWYSASISVGNGLSHVTLQAEYKDNGSDVYSVGPVYCTPSGYGITITWCGATGGGASNLTFGFNTNECIGPWGIGCFSGGYRGTINTWGQLVGWYTF